MKLLFATVAVAYAQDKRQVLNKDDGDKAAHHASCKNNNNCYLDGQNNSYYQSGPQGGCYCDKACHTKYNDCCHDMEYQCYNGVEDTLCPSAKCYKQNTQWMHGEDPATDIECEMDNDSCLSTRCSARSMTVTLDTELFHANSYKEGSFIELLESGARSLHLNGQQLSNNDWSNNGSGGIVVEVDYAAWSVQPTLTTVNGEPFITYTAKFTSMGNNDDPSNVIEFFVDHTIDASCNYDPEVKVDASFWVNQEDVFMEIAKDGELGEMFDCKFFEDATRKNEIKKHNIVNMGEMLYGQVDSNTVLYGLGYKLSGVVVSDPQNAANTYDVVANAATVNYSVDPVNSQASTGSDIFFEYLSFGFETYGVPNGNQNELKIECQVSLFIEE